MQTEYREAGAERGVASRSNGQFANARVLRLLKAIEEFAGVEVRLLDASGRASSFDGTGNLVPDGGAAPRLTDAQLEASAREGKPVLHEAGGGVQASFPFRLEGVRRGL